MGKVRTFYGHEGVLRPPHGLITDQAEGESEDTNAAATDVTQALALAGAPQELVQDVLNDLDLQDDETVESVTVETEVVPDGDDENADETVEEDETVTTVDGSTEVPAGEIEIVDEPVEEETSEAESFVCPECGDEFDSARGLGSHKRVHKED